WQDSEGRMFHGVSALLIEILAGINQQDTPLLLSLRTPEITITHLPCVSASCHSSLWFDSNRHQNLARCHRFPAFWQLIQPQKNLSIGAIRPNHGATEQNI
ncbi:hypothetical protein, partial [Aeromonas caviae]|uniref:hypothetical protein n=1 Tax=Aeromonas caviae TaxID=648 RepID=UPI001F195681